MPTEEEKETKNPRAFEWRRLPKGKRYVGRQILLGFPGFPMKW